MPAVLPKTVSAQVTEATGQKTKKITLLEQAVFVRVSFSRVGVTKKVPKENVTIDADKDLIRVTKRLLDSPEIKAIMKLDAEIRGWIHSQCIQSFIQDRLYCVALKSVVVFDKGMKDFRANRKVLVGKLVDAFEDIKARDRERLASNFREKDYPSAEAVREAFGMSWQYMALQAPKSLEAVSEELYKQAQAQISSEIADATSAVRFALREELAKLIDWGIDRLKPDDGGKRKTFRAKTKDGKETGFTLKLKEFFEAFESKDITSDAELRALVGSAKALLTDVDGESLKTSDTTRDTVRQGFEEIKSSLDAMLIDKPVRGIEVE